MLVLGRVVVDATVGAAVAGWVGAAVPGSVGSSDTDTPTSNRTIGSLLNVAVAKGFEGVEFSGMVAARADPEISKCRNELRCVVIRYLFGTHARFDYMS